MIDGSEKRKRQLVFELWNSRVFEKHRNTQCIVAMGNPWFPALSNNLDSRKPRAQLSGTRTFSFWAGNS